MLNEQAVQITFMNFLLDELKITSLDSTTVDKFIKQCENESNRLEKLVSQAASQAVPEPNASCEKFCVKCKHYEKIDDTEVQHEETFWETCHHPEINEMLCWNCEDTGCTKFEQK